MRADEAITTFPHIQPCCSSHAAQKHVGRATRVGYLPWTRGLLRWLAVTAMLSSLCACSSEPHLSFLDPQGPIAALQRKHFLEVLGLLAVFVAGPIFLAMPFFVWRYRYGAKSSRYTPKWSLQGSLELAMWGGPAIIVILLAVLVWRSTHTLDPYRPLPSDKPPLRVEVVGYDWKWLFIYPDQGIATVGELAVPVGQPLSIQLTSATVMQALHIPSLGSQIYAMGGMVTQLHLQADRPGHFMGENTMYNGDGFHQQQFTTVAMTQAHFDAWVDKIQSKGIPMDAIALKRLATEGTRQALSASFPAAASMRGNVYFTGVKPGLFPAIVHAVMQGQSIASPALLDTRSTSVSEPQP